MKVLVVGSGAREHAMVWRLALSPQVDMVYCAPGNGGTAVIAQNVNMAISTEQECDQLAGWAFNNQIDLVIVGPEVPLSHGIADTLMMFGVPVAGPTKAAARLEWSKSWARDFMKRHDIPSPGYTVIQGMEEIREKIRSRRTEYPLVMKADGLAGGKGAAVVKDPNEAEDALVRMQAMGALPGHAEEAKVVFEEYLEGVEVSAHAFTDGRNVMITPPACDYKRLLDGDQGPLTGGMGAYTPTKYITPELWEQVERDILLKTVRGMLEEGIPYRGFLYAGLMLTKNGPKVLEFNCRMGDPETQVLLPRLETPFEDICRAMASGGLTEISKIEWSEQAMVGVVLASQGYPSAQAVPQRIKGVADIDEGVLVFHASSELRGVTSLRQAEPQTGAPSVFRGLF